MKSMHFATGRNIFIGEMNSPLGENPPTYVKFVCINRWKDIYLFIINEAYIHMVDNERRIHFLHIYKLAYVHS